MVQAKIFSNKKGKEVLQKKILLPQNKSNFIQLKTLLMKALLLFPVLSIFFLSCRKTNTSDQLPPSTQIGAGTFGCKINGEVFVPKGSDGTGRPNPHISYDFDLQGQPFLSISSKQFVSGTFAGYCDIVFRNLNSTGDYYYPVDFENFVTWQSLLGNCYTPAYDTTVKKWGKGIITKLDIPNRIISGTFDCKFKHGQCDTVYITEGRFDIKF